MDPATGKVYYKNESTGETSWEEPKQLPHGWTRLVDHANGGKVYFHNATTGATSWSHPADLDAEPALVVESSLPEGWKAVTDPASGRLYYTNEALGATSWEKPTAASAAGLPPGWESVTDPASGRVYYKNESTSETSWEKPKLLPHGWTRLVDHANGGKEYFHNAISGAVSWTHPADLDGLEVEGTEPPPPSASSDDEEAPPMQVTTSKKKKKKKKKKKLVRWAWKPTTSVSLTESLFKSKLDASSSDVESMPGYMLELFANVFKLADRDGDGSLSTLELMFMLEKRAKGTALAGDSHAIFTLNTHLAKQASEGGDEHGEIGVTEFARGLMRSMLDEPNGHVADWILKELQSEEAEWSVHDHEGRTYYRHDTSGDVQWMMPEILVEMARCKAEVGGGEG
jgi:hypothetical protein